MRSATLPVVLLALVWPAVLLSQPILTVSPQQCVWRAGDNTAWAASNLDESDWQPYTNWKLEPSEPRIWVRCHADLSSLGAADQPALQVKLYAAYQIFVEGRSIGAAGNPQSGAFSMNVIRNWQFSGDLSHPVTIALRITFHIASLVPTGPLPPLEIDAGSREVLNYRRSSLILAGIQRNLIPAICFSIIGIAGIFLLGLYISDRSRRDLRLLSANCIMVTPLYLNYLGAGALLPYSATVNFLSWGIPAIVSNVTRTLFFFALARRRVPLFFWVLIGLSILLYPAADMVPFLPPAQALWLDSFRSHQLSAVAEFAAIFESFAPFVAFLPWKRLTRQMKPLAVLCMAWGATMMCFFAVRFSGADIPGIPNLQARWGNAVADAEAFMTLSVLVALLALLFREQQQTARERASLAGEMQAASEIQRMLAPAAIDTAPGLKIDVAFHPMREVGGDFYHCRVLFDGRQRVVLGDVSGKGAAAAMAATLLLGAAAARDSDSPTALLAHLNRVLRENNLSGFATCLCTDVMPDGAVTLANAGHLPPYLNGVELLVEGVLPLGAVSGLHLPAMHFTLAEGDSLMLMTDGVVEAQDTHGQLFGFERIARLLHEGSDGGALAAAAQDFGQEDDITVLTLTRLATPTQSPTELSNPSLAPA